MINNKRTLKNDDGAKWKKMWDMAYQKGKRVVRASYDPEAGMYDILDEPEGIYTGSEPSASVPNKKEAKKSLRRFMEEE